MIRVEGLGADAVLCGDEYPIPGVFTAAHNEVGRYRILVVGAAAQQDAPAGIGIAPQQLREILNIHGQHSSFQ